MVDRPGKADPGVRSLLEVRKVPGMSSSVQLARRVRAIVHATLLALVLAPAAVAQAGNASSFTPKITPDGRYVVFESSANDLGTGIADGSVAEIYRHDRTTGNKILVSVSQAGDPADAPSNEPQVTADGRYIVFSSAAKNLSTRDDDASRDVFVFDAATDTTRLVSVRSDGGIAVGNSQEPAIAG